MFNRYFKNIFKITPDDVFHYVDKKVTLFTKKHYQEISAIYSSDEGAFYSFNQAKELGIKCIFDLPNSLEDISKIAWNRKDKKSRMGFYLRNI